MDREEEAGRDRRRRSGPNCGGACEPPQETEPCPLGKRLASEFMEPLFKAPKGREAWTLL